MSLYGNIDDIRLKTALSNGSNPNQEPVEEFSNFSSKSGRFVCFIVIFLLSDTFAHISVIHILKAMGLRNNKYVWGGDIRLKDYQMAQTQIKDLP